jgi:predicted ATP-dependent protease
VPVKQSIAVTGSVNQKGDIQAIGGVNEKIEGFFDVCKVRSLTGEQGVIIPQSNVQNLVLREDVVEAVRHGRFHIWAVATVDQAMEVLSGLPSGEREADGHFPSGTLNYVVDKRLTELAQRMRGFGPEGATGGRPPDNET